MITTEFIQAISVKKPDFEYFAGLILRDDTLRDEMIRQMLTNPDIMVYYHCYETAARASDERPELFYKYWDEMVPLLKHENSYHRDIALTLLANLTYADAQIRFSRIFDDYFEHINDAKFMTARCCVRNSLKIIRNEPEMTGRIVSRLLDVDHLCDYSEKQLALLKFDILDVLDGVFPEISGQPGGKEFIRGCVACASPKTRRKAKEMAEKY